MQNLKARSFVTIMVALALAALFLRFAVEELIKRNISQNQADAQATLKLISTALENYAQDHLGVYPTDLSVLVKDKPPYLDRNYLAQSSLKGYDYNCPRLEAGGYSCAASPVNCNLSGKMLYSVTTGGLMLSEECSGKE